MLDGQRVGGRIVSEASTSVRRRLSYEELDPADARSFATLYNIYAEMFPLPDEREPPGAFFDLAALNVNTDIQMALGPWREIVAAIRLWQGGPIVGGHVFGATTSREHIAFGCMSSVQAMYTFLERRARGTGPIADMRRYMEEESLRVFGFPAPSVRPLIFLEVNNPLRMTPEQVEEDAQKSGMDPFKRYVFWRRNGFRPLDFAYTQPRLRPEAEPVRYLDLFCSDIPQAPIPVAVIEKHLAAFISISVLKGTPAADDPDFRAMATAIAAHTHIPYKRDDSTEQRDIVAAARGR